MHDLLTGCWSDIVHGKRNRVSVSVGTQQPSCKVADRQAWGQKHLPQPVDLSGDRVPWKSLCAQP